MITKANADFKYQCDRQRREFRDTRSQLNLLNDKLDKYKEEEAILLMQHSETTQAVLVRKVKDVEDIIENWRAESKRDAANMLETQTLRIEQRLGDTKKTVFDKVEMLDKFIESLRISLLDEANQTVLKYEQLRKDMAAAQKREQELRQDFGE